MGIGPYALAFNDSFLKSQDNARRQGQADLQEAMTLEAIRQQGQEAQDLGGLTAAFQARRAAMANQPPAAPGMPGPAPEGGAGPEQLAGPPPEPMAAAPGLAPTPPAPAGAPAGEGPRRKSLLEEIDPAQAGRLLRTGAGRSALKDLETAEKEQELADNRKLAETVFGEATTAMKAGNVLEYYDKAAKAMRIMGNHESAGKYLEHAMNLRGDEEEGKKANEDLSRWLKAQSAYATDPSPENYNKFMESLGEANSKASRALRVQIANNVLAKTFNQNPKVTGFSRTIAGAYRDAFATGKDPDAEQIFRSAAAKDPEGFNAYIYDALTNQKQLPEVVLKKVLRWDTLDGKDIPKTISEKSFFRTRARFPTLKTDDPKFMEAWWADEVKMTRELEKEKKPGEEEKAIRTDVSEMRKRLNDVRAELRRSPGMAEEDPERYKDLRDEEKQALVDLQAQEARLRKSSGIPEAKPQEVEIPVNAPNAKLKPGDQKYTLAAKNEIRRLKAAGYTPEQIQSMMSKKGWQ
jgi:hypothetical protein